MAAVPTTFFLRDSASAQKLPSTTPSLSHGGSFAFTSSDFTPLHSHVFSHEWTPWKRKTEACKKTGRIRELEHTAAVKSTCRRTSKSVSFSEASCGKHREVGISSRATPRTSVSALDFRKCRSEAADCTKHSNNGSLLSKTPLPSSPPPSPRYPDSCSETSSHGASKLPLESARLGMDPMGSHGHPQGSPKVEEMNPLRMPRHVAIIMDGNSRWAVQHGLQTQSGHEAGVRAFREAVRLSGRWGIRALTVFAFSSENWQRSEWEVSFLMKLFENSLRTEAPNLHRENVRVRFVGNLARLPRALRGVIDGIHALTASNNGLELTVAVSYGAREEIIDACRALVRDSVRPEDVTEAALGAALATHSQVGDPDLLIRTSGEQRLSNFMLWQLAYAELYFSDVFWPDFGEEEYRAAILAYQKRDRRFGRRQS